jgi:hypothetical protein
MNEIFGALVFIHGVEGGAEDTQPYWARPGLSLTLSSS